MSDGYLLLVEDEPAMTTVIATGLEARGHIVRCVTTGREALDMTADWPPTVIVLDLGLPDIDGLDVCRRIRKWSQVPIIVVTADGAEDRKVDALDCGADDYVTKPFSMRELLARVGVAIRHQQSRVEDSAIVTVGDLVVDIAHHQVVVAEQPVDVTPKEFAILALLARHAGRVITHRTILAEIWGPAGAGHIEYLRVYARALRKKLGEDPNQPRLITEPGVGYRIVDRADGVLPARPATSDPSGVAFSPQFRCPWR
jgi:two-component system, OmpR family, KDP operon response regulator KdpE